MTRRLEALCVRHADWMAAWPIWIRANVMLAVGGISLLGWAVLIGHAIPVIPAFMAAWLPPTYFVLLCISLWEIRNRSSS